jgi:hypothetical protein
LGFPQLLSAGTTRRKKVFRKSLRPIKDVQMQGTRSSDE